MIGMTRPLNMPNESAMRLLAEQNRRRSLAEMDSAQDRIRQDEASNNQLLAQRYALDNSHQLQQGPNPRTVTDTSMTIGGPGMEGGVQVQRNSRSVSGGGGTQGVRQLPPDLQGRFMPLIELGQQSLPSSPIPPEKSMPAAQFGPGDARAHQDAAFARTKDRAGQLGRSAIDSLAAELAGRGISGRSGAFGQGLADIVSQSVQPLADLNVAHLGQEYQAAQRARELAEGRAGTEFQGGISQRGQTISAQQALDQLRTQLALAKYQGEIAQRGQDLTSIYQLL